jgi:diacylglycerol kinase (ATP)
MSVSKRIKSVRYALDGVYDLVKNQPNARIHLLATLIVVCAGNYFQLKPGEWLAIIGCITLVISMEAMNTALEYLTDLVSPEYHPLAGKAKDAAAAAVLISAVGAVVIGLVVFMPYLFQW